VFPFVRLRQANPLATTNCLDHSRKEGLVEDKWPDFIALQRRGQAPGLLWQDSIELRNLTLAVLTAVGGALPPSAFADNPSPRKVRAPARGQGIAGRGAARWWLAPWKFPWPRYSPCREGSCGRR
jgi:hypothetical protein